MKADLTLPQRRALEKLVAACAFVTAYKLQESRATLDALVRRRFAERRRELGYLFSPRVGISYMVTESGKKEVRDALDTMVGS